MITSVFNTTFISYLSSVTAGTCSAAPSTITMMAVYVPVYAPNAVPYQGIPLHPSSTRNIRHVLDWLFERLTAVYVRVHAPNAAIRYPSTPVLPFIHRHVLDWLFEHLTAGRDHLSLTVSSAYDEKGAIRPATHKLLTAFGVQARVNAFDANQTMLAGG